MLLWQELVFKGITIGGADSRRLITQGLIKVNDKVIKDGQFECKQGDIIEFERSRVISKWKVGD